MSFRLGSILSLAVLLNLVGCGGTSQSSLPITISVTPESTAVSSGQTVQLTATITDSSGHASPATANNDSTGVDWSASSGSTDSNGNFTAPSGSQSETVSVTATSKKDHSKSASATIHVIAPGTVTTTANAQVALYSISTAGAAEVSVKFGLDTNYGQVTWQQPATDASAASLFIAGMKANTTYHMAAVVKFDDGAQFTDVDHTFTTGIVEIPAEAPNLVVTTTPGTTPQGGVEVLDLANGVARPTITDLDGNILWAYTSVPNGTIANPIKLMPNGHFLMNFSVGVVDGQSSVLREVDLAGTTIWQMTAADLNTALAAATCAGCNITVVGTHHDVAILPNGHLVVIATLIRDVSGTSVQGDVLIDLDQNHKPVWLWNEFDHLDINRRPFLFPDWTHTNAIRYSPTDGNLLVSIRHQNWVIKIDYANGNGTGDILWRLGYQGDFSLVGGTDPTDWFYAQHGPTFVSSNTAGNFALTLFDNGDDRVFPPSVTCGSAGAPPCLYSTVPVFQIDEQAKTATLTFHHTAPWYSFFGGNAEVLANGHVEYCESAGGPNGNQGEIYEVTQDSSAQTVWHMTVTGQFAYRGQRMPSFYPGVQW